MDKLATLTNQFQELSELYNQLGTQYQTLHGEKLTLESRVSAEQIKHKTAEEKWTELNNKYLQLSADKLATELSLNDLKSKVTSLTIANTQIKEEKELIETKLDSREKRIITLENNERELNNDILNLKKMINKLELAKEKAINEKSSLQNQLDAAIHTKDRFKDDKVEWLNKEIREIELKRALLEGKLAECNKAKRDLELEQDNTQKQYGSNIKTMKKELEDKIFKLQNQLQSATLNINKGIETVQNLENEKAKAENRELTLIAQKIELESNIKTLNKTLASKLLKNRFLRTLYTKTNRHNIKLMKENRILKKRQVLDNSNLPLRSDNTPKTEDNAPEQNSGTPETPALPKSDPAGPVTVPSDSSKPPGTPNPPTGDNNPPNSSTENPHEEQEEDSSDSSRDEDNQDELDFSGLRTYEAISGQIATNLDEIKTL